MGCDPTVKARGTRERLGVMEDDKRTTKGGLLFIVWLTLVALKADGIIDWLWVAIIVGPVVIYWTVSIVTSLLALAAARRMTKMF